MIRPICLHHRFSAWHVRRPIELSLLLFTGLLSATASRADDLIVGSTPSIRDQLEGKVEQNEEADPEEKKVPRFSSSLERNALQDQKYESQDMLFGDGLYDRSKLQGKVERQDLMNHLKRSFPDLFGKSVRVLPGSDYSSILQGQADNSNLNGSNLDNSLKAENFQLPLKAMTPRQDFSRLGSIRQWRTKTVPEYRWSVGNGWSIGNGWRVGNYWTVGIPYRWGRGRDNWYGYYWGYNTAYGGWQGNMPGYRRANRIQGQADWGNWDLPQNNLAVDPNFYTRRLPGSIPPIRPINMNTNLGWGIPLRPVDQSILWDAWYQKVSNAMYRNWAARGRQLGIATLRITVRRNKTIEAQILRVSTQAPDFKKNLLDAVASLNGNSVLDFPPNSQRQIVSFNCQFNASTNTANGAFSERSGEVERVILPPRTPSKTIPRPGYR